MLTLDYAQIAGLLGLGFAFAAMFTAVGFALVCVFGNGGAEDKARDGEDNNKKEGAK